MKTPVSASDSDAMIQRHKVQIGSELSKLELKTMRRRILVQALNHYDDGLLHEALDGFMHCLAIEESFRWRDWSLTSTLQYNVASVLHNMRMFDAAIVWYERCLELLLARYAPSASWIC